MAGRCSTWPPPDLHCSTSLCVARSGWSSTCPGSSSTQPSPPWPSIWSDGHWDWVLDLSGGHAEAAHPWQGPVEEGAGEEMNEDAQDDPVWVWTVTYCAACLDAPQNSLEAVRLAAKNVAKYIGMWASVLIWLVRLSMIPLTGSPWPMGRWTALPTPSWQSFTWTPIMWKRSVDVWTVCGGVCQLNSRLWNSLMRLSNLQISFHKQFLTLKTNSMITSLYPNLLKLQSFNPEILTAISTRPNLLSMAAWVGTSGGKWEKFSGIK